MLNTSLAFEIRTAALLANKFYQEFVAAKQDTKGVVEPEWFFECWIARHVLKAPKQFKSRVFSMFIKRLKSESLNGHN